MKTLLMLVLLSSQMSHAALVSAAKEPEAEQQLTKLQRAAYEKRLMELWKTVSYFDGPTKKNVIPYANKVWSQSRLEEDLEYRIVLEQIAIINDLLSAKKLSKDQIEFVKKDM